MAELNVDINSLICKAFVKIFIMAFNCEVDRAVLKGGRSSTKSQVIAFIIVIGTMIFKQSSVALVRYGNKIEERLVNIITETIAYLHVEKYWKLRRSPFEYVLLDDRGKETKISIKFAGCDDPHGLKSYKPRSGSFRYVWFEELTNFDSLKMINNLTQTFARGKGGHCILMSYNPPESTGAWVNEEYNVPCGKILGYDSSMVLEEFTFEIEPGLMHTSKQVIHHSTYLDVIDSGHADWLGTTFISEAAKCKVENPTQYEWAYLGKVVGTNANVFRNVKEWDGDTNGLNIIEISRGFDWGYGGPDPCAYTELWYDSENRRLYALDEFGVPNMSVEDIEFEIRQKNKHNFPVKADSAVPILNKQLTKKGINIDAVHKKPDSVRGGIKWLQGLNGIYICSMKTPKTYKEFKNYSYIIDKKTEEITSQLSEKGNHFIDSSRYALIDIIKYS